MAKKIARQIVLAARPQGKPQLTDFRLEETAIPAPSAGQVLLQVQYLSLDPYMRGRMNDVKSYVPPAQIGEVMVGGREVIPGIGYSIEGMRRGGKRKVKISPHLGYREAGVENLIPPNAVLVYEIEVLEVKQGD